jgi:hypothetical protein
MSDKPLVERMVGKTNDGTTLERHGAASRPSPPPPPAPAPRKQPRPTATPEAIRSATPSPKQGDGGKKS